MSLAAMRVRRKADLTRYLDSGMVVRPGLFKPMCKFLHGKPLFPSQNEKTRRSCADTAHHPQEVLH